MVRDDDDGAGPIGQLAQGLEQGADFGRESLVNAVLRMHVDRHRARALCARYAR